MEIDLEQEYHRLGVSYDAFERLLAWPDERLHRVDAGVSAWSPAQHLYHILVANGMMLKGIAMICRGDERVLQEGALNAAGRYVLTAEHFPRGQGQAPRPTQPPEHVTREALQQALERSRRRYAETADVLSSIGEDAGWLPHGFLGQLTASEWLRLARIHSEHHLTIIQEVAGV